MKKEILLTVLVLLSVAVAYSQNTFPSSGNVGIGNTNPTAKITFNDVDGPNPSGISWYSPAPLNYGIYRTSGVWQAPSYQQLKLQWDTGIILSPGTGYEKSYVDINGDGLRVTSGNVGIGTVSPLQKMTIKSTGTLTGISSTDYDFGITDGATNQLQLLGLVNTIGDYGLLQVIKGGVGARNLVLQTQGGNVGIGINNPAEKLSVNGNIRAKEVKVETANWPDYVFEKNYKLASLIDLESYIKIHKHLPGIPTAQAVEKEGIAVSETIKAQQKMIEELTLHLIEKDKELKESNKKINELDQKVDTILKKISNK